MSERGIPTRRRSGGMCNRAGCIRGRFGAAHIRNRPDRYDNGPGLPSGAVYCDVFPSVPAFGTAPRALRLRYTPSSPRERGSVRNPCHDHKTGLSSPRERGSERLLLTCRKICPVIPAGAGIRPFPEHDAPANQSPSGVDCAAAGEKRMETPARSVCCVQSSTGPLKPSVPLISGRIAICADALMS